MAPRIPVQWHEAEVLVLEEPVHASHVQPVTDRPGEDVPQPGPETSDDQHVPGVAVVPDAAHHPGPTSGAQVDLGGWPGRGEPPP